jgi:Domain of unknown function (DUF3576)
LRWSLPLRSLNIVFVFSVTALLAGCTPIENDLNKGLAYGSAAKDLTRKADARRAPGTIPSGINAYLWKASLDSVVSLPLVTADPATGVIVTDWYESPSNANDRTKLKIEVLSRDLRADTLRVSIARQTRDGEIWANAPAQATATRTIEEQILDRARDLRGW